MAEMYVLYADLVTQQQGEANLKRLSGGETAAAHPRIVIANAAMVGEVHEYLRKRGVTVPVDDPPPEDFRQNAISIELDYLTRGLGQRPTAIEVNAKVARTYFEKVATGKHTFQDSNTATTAGEQGAQVFHSRRLGNFDFTDKTSEIYSRMPPL